ncbi:folylpolyglutamate synthase/dihydrofolate synthase family protein [Fulvimarina sp. 2208YS6-2-32]|uniref:Folylpolyglutamate synthase/dihydrofolate synthase family protein n=1 Tax=Fulvimarina uroteuthidis TaxID=3098149 RepID=A0ABU5HYJ5_9HYPH|nr:folylpolyglutamate synthase/dihydrofolate synthase family protein [Fulvimarina sp. 2208YS6-2-32]MDY8107664.1 folylpolyglutamate synthase/dihydrofolate synthase family protein [Fulvimarina sp. 2208YS6-2-32]
MTMTSLAHAEIDALLSRLPKGYDLSLERIRTLVAGLGNPHLKLPPTIHVAGTNGKGSTSAFCRAILEADGTSVHVHTSPHLVSWHERYRLGRADGPGRLVPDAVLADAVARAAKAVGDMPITVFEILTAVTFLLFSEHPADAAIVEVGLGGRFDATNLIERPAVTVITPVSLDHQSYLGDSVELIAAEKAGIIKPGVPLVIGAQTEPVATEVITRIAARNRAPVAIYGQDYFAFEERGRLVYQDGEGLIDLPLPRLSGRHQISNAATAIAALRKGGFAPGDAALEAGMTSVEWPGRLQKITSGPLFAAVPDGGELWLDGGHNPGAGAAISEVFANLEDRVSRPLFLICGMLNTKDPTGFFEAFNGIARRVLTVPLRTTDAGIAPQELAEFALDTGLDALAVDTIEAAIRTISNDWSEPPAPRFLICGSLYLVGEALDTSGLAPQ